MNTKTFSKSLSAFGLLLGLCGFQQSCNLGTAHVPTDGLPVCMEVLNAPVEESSYSSIWIWRMRGSGTDRVGSEHEVSVFFARDGVSESGAPLYCGNLSGGTFVDYIMEYHFTFLTSSGRLEADWIDYQPIGSERNPSGGYLLLRADYANPIVTERRRIASVMEYLRSHGSASDVRIAESVIEDLSRERAASRQSGALSLEVNGIDAATAAAI